MERGLERISPREERRGVPIRAHAQHHRRKAIRQGAEGFARPCEGSRIGRIPARVEGQETGVGGRALQHSLIDQTGIGAVRGFGHPTFVHERHQHLRPFDVPHLAESAKEFSRRAAARNSDCRNPRLFKVGLDVTGNPKGQCLGEFLLSREIVPEGHQEASSYQVRPSRSIKAIDPVGPQVPAE